LPSTPRTLPPPLPPSRRDLQIAATTAAADRGAPSPSPPTPPPPFARRSGDASDATFSLYVYPLPGFQTEKTTAGAEELGRFRFIIAAIILPYSSGRNRMYLLLLLLHNRADSV
jgi:hypothetical protein